MTRSPRLVPTEELFHVLGLLRAAGPITRNELARRTSLSRKVARKRSTSSSRASWPRKARSDSPPGPSAARGPVPRRRGTRLVPSWPRPASPWLADLADHPHRDARGGRSRGRPDATLEHVEELFDKLLSRGPRRAHRSTHRIGIPGPVPSPPVARWRPVRSGMADYAVRDRLSTRYEARPVDNDANLMPSRAPRRLARGTTTVLHQDQPRSVEPSSPRRARAQSFAGEFGTSSSPPTSRSGWAPHQSLTQIASARAIAGRAPSSRRRRSAILAAIMSESRAIGAREVFTAAAASYR